jgi:acetyl esterase/lipase
MKRAYLLAIVLLFAALSFAQSADDFTATLPARYSISPNVTYATANNVPLKLDLYLPRNITDPVPVVLVIHGGGWVEGTKEGSNVWFTPYLQMNWAVVNIDYRLGRVSRAPAAVEDSRCALHWLFSNATKYKFDPHRVVVTGDSAGGHLALTTGMLQTSAGFDNTCRVDSDPFWTEEAGTSKDPQVAAIVNWYGITDVLEMLHAPNARGYAIEWIGHQSNADELARSVSPVNMVRKGLPPIISIHGNTDKLVPYEQAVRLHKALDQAGVTNQLFTVKDAGHGDFTPEQSIEIWRAIRAFLDKNVKAAPAVPLAR